MKKHLLLPALAFWALVAPCLPARAAEPSLPAAAIDRAVRSLLHASKTPGATIAVVEDGRIVYAHGYGLRNVAGKLGADANTHYQIGSMTKQFTAAAILQLRDAGKLTLNEKLAKILPTAPHADEITIRELLTHTSGLRNYTNISGFVRLAGKPGSYNKMIALIAKKPLNFRPGSRFDYSNTNYILLGKIVEVLSGESYQKYVQEHEFRPAGMAHTTWISDEAHLHDMATGYMVAKDGKAVPAPPLRSTWAWSAGAIVSTVGDFARWTNALSSGKIVPLHDFAEMTTPVHVPYGSSGGYGFGLIRDRFQGQARIEHGGGTFGFSTDGALFPSQHLAIVAFTDSRSGPAGAIVEHIFDVLHPKLAATELTPVAGENLAFRARMKAFIIPLLKGHLDRSQITPAASKALSDATVAQVAALFSSLGAPRAFIYRGKTVRSTGTLYVYLVHFASQTVKLTLGIDAKTKKFAVFFFQPQ